MKIKFALLFALSASACLANNAVSSFNWNAGASYGRMESEDGCNLDASLTLPVRENFGFQADALYTDVDDVDFGGFGAQFFWRNNDKGLVGAGIGGVHGDLLDSYEASLKAEYYLGRVTLGARAGLASIEYDDPAPFIDTDKDSAFGQIYVSFYPMDDLLITARAENRFGNTCYSADAEFELPIRGLSIFASAMDGAYGYDHKIIGLRYYFGSGANLKGRQRGDNTGSLLGGILHAIGNYGAEYNRKWDRYAEENGGGGSSGSYGSYGSVTMIGIGAGSYGSIDFNSIHLIPIDGGD